VENRNTICFGETTWGDVEFSGAANLSPLPDGKYEIRVPLPIISILYDRLMVIPAEPIFSLENNLTADKNEEQDVATII